MEHKLLWKKVSAEYINVKLTMLCFDNEYMPIYKLNCGTLKTLEY